MGTKSDECPRCETRGRFHVDKPWLAAVCLECGHTLSPNRIPSA